MAATEVFPVHLTAQRRRVLGSISDWHDLHGYAPTVRDLCDQIGVASPSTIHVHLTILREEGCVDWLDGQARTLHLTSTGRAALYG